MDTIKQYATRAIIALSIIIIGVGIFIIIKNWPREIPEPTPNGQPFPTNTPNNSSSEPETEIPDTRGNVYIPKQTQDDTTGGPKTKLTQIYSGPVAGFSIVKKSDDTFVRFVDKRTGFVKEHNLNTNIQENITTQPIPKVGAAVFTQSTKNIFYQYEKDFGFLQSIILNISTNTPKTSITPREVTEVVPHPLDTESFVYGEKDEYGFSLFRQETTPIKTTKIVSLLFPSWRIEWPEKNTIVLTTKASSRISGFMYTTPVTTRNGKEGSLTPIIFSKNGLVTKMSHTTKYVLFSESIPRSSLVSIMDTKTREETQLGLQTIADKCTWSKENPDLVWCAVPRVIPSGEYPDDWYQGKQQFNDSLYIINAKSKDATRVVNLDSFGVVIDVISPASGNNDNLLVFKNKVDQSLWAMELD